MNRQTRLLIIFLIAVVLSLLAYCSGESPGNVGTLVRDIAEIVLTEEAALAETPQGTGTPAATRENALPTLPPVVPATATMPQTVSPTSTSLYTVYFTDPECPPEEERSGGIEDEIAADLLQARERVEIAAFDLDAEPIIDALITLEQENIDVRVVTDSDNGDLSGIRRLRRHGISVVEDKRSGLMHNKFIVIDARILWVGSLNFTTNGFYCNNNNLVRFESAELAANYVAEMAEMYDERSFGPKSPENTPNEILTLGGMAVANYFSPERELELINIIARAVVRAEEEILFLAFSFTSDEIGEAMLGRADAGIPVRGIFERVGAQSGYYPVMAASGLPNVMVRLDGNPRIMHHKIIIVDRTTVIFGSFNFTASANRSNDESIIVVTDPDFAQIFVDEFYRLWEIAVEE